MKYLYLATLMLLIMFPPSSYSSSEVKCYQQKKLIYAAVVNRYYKMEQLYIFSFDGEEDIVVTTDCRFSKLKALS